MWFYDHHETDHKGHWAGNCLLLLLLLLLPPARLLVLCGCWL